MIPLDLYISGFLSYQDPVELDFTGIELACISGSNGAGKSSLLDAITWVLFGQARKRDDSLINAQSQVAEIRLTFAYEGNTYRVQRTKPRDKTALLEFHILQQPPAVNPPAGKPSSGDGHLQTWKPLTERTLRDTEFRIQQTLRLDYETFVNASFFLQGKADQFTQQRPGDRKRILSSILGLEVWEAYRQRAFERRRQVEAEVASLDGRLKEINAELAEEEARKKRLKSLQTDLDRLSQERLAQEKALETVRQAAAFLAEKKKNVDMLARQVDSARSRLQALEQRAHERQVERDDLAGILARAEQIESAYQSWQSQRLALEGWEKIAGQFREQEKRRLAPRDVINAEGARLQQEQQSLLDEQARRQADLVEIEKLQAQIEPARRKQEELEAQLAQRDALRQETEAVRSRQAEAAAENQRLRREMDELKERINQLNEAEGAICPLCGGPLTPQDRQNLVESLQQQGTEMGDRYRLNQALARQLEEQMLAKNHEMEILARAEIDLRAVAQMLAQLNSRLELLEGQQAAWEAQGSLRLAQVSRILADEAYAMEARQELAQVDAELKAIGYAAAEHDSARQAELQGRAADGDMRLLENARAALAPLERELAELQKQASELNIEVEQLREEHQRAAGELQEAQAQAPDLDAAEANLMQVREQENRLRLEVGAARQEVLVLDDLKVRRKNLEAERQDCARQVGLFRQLERSFGKDGVPALLIEQALPEIEGRANEVLEHLSGGNMAVRFVTQAAYKDKHRDDLKETLDIQISDGAGMRDYEMFSGGEAFRVNFAIRLALSQVLAQRAGARLQTLVIDEGFGSQDTQGRQRLIEAINLVRSNFAKILVITHIDDLKDSFPTRIEVEKTTRGSQIQVL
jgi:DNA repair protein SbcC/Rad50